MDGLQNTDWECLFYLCQKHEEFMKCESGNLQNYTATDPFMTHVIKAGKSLKWVS